MTDLETLADRYVAVWNEPDAEARRAQIAAIWTEDGAHFAPSHEARGYDALETRVRGAYEKFVAEGGYVFRRHGAIDGHHGVVRFKWEMTPAAGGPIAAVGSDVFILAPDGRLDIDYQFSEPTPA
ncbi:MAG TPA: nuclear transport factor 2 family protein [Caulobacteraceae bacterium]|nr:nuclear transport factor 2 family protein [Caulobacteraceae bacterium]